MPFEINLTLVRKSGWTFDTYASGGLGAGVFAASGGMIELISPAGKKEKFYYGGVGVGTPLKLPSWLKRIPGIKELSKFIVKIQKLPNRVGSTPDFWSTGDLYISSNFEGDALTASDIRGFCGFAELGAGLIVGHSGTAMLLNLDPWLIPLMNNPIGFLQLYKSAKAVLLMRGNNVGIQAGVSVGGYFGYLY